MATEVFISYSHRDNALRDELGIHLSGLKRLGIISTWHDRMIVGGSDFNSEISEHLTTANIILLLISPDFIASDYCFDVELSAALEKHEHATATVLPVILRPCDWHDLPFGKLLASPPDGKPIVKYPSLDDGFLEVIKELKRIIKKSSDDDIKKTVALDPSIPLKKEIRSSNLRIKKTFSDEEKDQYEADTFEYIAKYFENSMNELSNRNSSISFRYRRIDSNKFENTIYLEGKEKISCTIRLKSDSFFASGISFSYGRSQTGINESLLIENDGYIQYLKPTMYSFSHRITKETKLNMEGAAEFYWELFIKDLQ